MHAGDTQMLPYAEEALRQVHGCQILVNDLHASNVGIVPESSKFRVQVFFGFVCHKLCQATRNAMMRYCFNSKQTVMHRVKFFLVEPTHFKTLTLSPSLAD